MRVILVVVAAILFFGAFLFSIWLSRPRHAELTRLEAIPADQASRYRRWWMYEELFGLITVIPVATYLILGALIRVAGSLGPQAGESVFFFRSGWAAFAVPAAFLSIPPYFLVASVIRLRLVGGVAPDYRIFCRNARRGIAPQEIVLSAWSVAIALPLLFFGVVAVTRFDRDEIVLHPDFSLMTRHYPYNRIVCIAVIANRRADSGRLYPAPRHVIQFDDGAIWSSWDGGRTPDLVGDTAAIRFASDRSGRPVQSFSLTDELPRKLAW